MITLGSPLGLRSIVFDRLTSHVYPDNVRRWVNVCDRNDLVAAEWDLDDCFAQSAHGVESIRSVDNGGRPHNAEYYLIKEQTGRALMGPLRAH